MKLLLEIDGDAGGAAVLACVDLGNEDYLASLLRRLRLYRQAVAADGGLSEMAFAEDGAPAAFYGPPGGEGAAPPGLTEGREELPGLDATAGAWRAGLRAELAELPEGLTAHGLQLVVGDEGVYWRCYLPDEVVTAPVPPELIEGYAANLGID